MNNMTEKFPFIKLLGSRITTMLFSLRKRVLQSAVLRAMRRPAPDQIPLSLPRAAGIDCYSLTINGEGDKWSILVDCAGVDGMTGRWLDDDSFSAPVSMSWHSATDAEFHCTHYIGIHEFQYESPLQFIFQEILLIPRLEVLQHEIAQRRFNRQRLVRHQPRPL